MTSSRESAQAGDETEVGFLALLRGNADLRNLWIGNLISLLGDWFNFIALINVVDHLTGSAFALGIVFVSKMLPAAIASPFAGLIVDRFDRRRIMILADIARAIIVLGLLLVDDSSKVYLVFILTTLQVVVSAVFQPAQSAVIPAITSAKELLTANALMAASWSVMLAIGAALGGVATNYLGPQVVFIIDSLSYLLSAVFIFRVAYRSPKRDRSRGTIFRAAIADIVSGWRYMTTHPAVGRISLAKSAWALGGGGLVFALALIGEAISPDAPDLAIGVLFAARGIGTGIGPIVARATFKDRARWPLVLGAGVSFSGASYLLAGAMPWTFWIAAFVVVAHAASGANWVLATVLIQERSSEEFMGRVFATEWLLVMLADTVSIVCASLLVELGIADLRTAVLVFALVQIVTGILWIVTVVPIERRASIRSSDEKHVNQR